MKKPSEEEILIPLWLCQAQQDDLLETRKSRWLKNNYLEKTLQAIHTILLRDQEQENILASPGLFQRLDPRCKIIGSFFLLVTFAAAQQLIILFLLHGLLGLFVFASRVNWRHYYRRVLLPAFLFTGGMLLPALTGHITPGEALITVTGPFGHTIAVTRQGVTAVCLVLLRTTGSLGTVLLVVLTTRWDTLTKTLAYFKIPGSLVMILDLTYRYLFLFLMLLDEYILGRKSRMVAKERQKEGREWIGLAIAGFFRMAMEYSRDIEAAMRERGYTGMYHFQPPGRIGLFDIGFLGIMFMLCLIVWGG